MKKRRTRTLLIWFAAAAAVASTAIIMMTSTSKIDRACALAYHNQHHLLSRLLISNPELVNQRGNLRRPSKFVDAPPLLWAVRGGSNDAVSMLIQKGADVNQLDELGRSPLIVSCFNSNINIAKELINSGADVNYCEGSTSPLIAAMAADSKQLVELLITHGANATSADNCSALHFARSRGLSKYVTMLKADDK
jgi:ankyrin repeat protein